MSNFLVQLILLSRFKLRHCSHRGRLCMGVWCCVWSVQRDDDDLSDEILWMAAVHFIQVVDRSIVGVKSTHPKSNISRKNRFETVARSLKAMTARIMVISVPTVSVLGFGINQDRQCILPSKVDNSDHITLNAIASRAKSQD